MTESDESSKQVVLSSTEETEEDESNLVDGVLILWRNRWLIGGVFFVAVLTTLIVTIRMPKVFMSTTTLLIPREGASGGILSGLGASGLLQQLPEMSLPSLTPNRDTLTSILKSRRVAQAVAERFQLQERYKARYLEDVIGGLQRKTRIAVSKEGVISIAVEDHDPQMAAQIANFYVEQLDQLVSQFGTGTSGRRRALLSEQFARTKRNLEEKEEELRRFQERNRAIVLQDQTRSVIEAAARLKGEIMGAEVQVQVMRTFATEANPDIVTMRRKIEEMKRQLAQVEYGDRVSRPQGQSPDRSELSVPFAKVPELGLELARLTRDMKTQEILVMLLSQQLEQAKMSDEARDFPTVQVLDRAVPAVRHSRPNLRYNLKVSGALSLVVGGLLAFFIEFLKKSSSWWRRT